MKESILVSACLLGVHCRYDGGSQKRDLLDALSENYHLVPVCPEQLGGLPTPRTPSERVGAGILTKDGRDVTGEYLRGAEEALHLAQKLGCKKAILKARSPSCGSGTVYDGTFSGSLTPGDGVTAELLKKNGIEVLSDEEIGTLSDG